MPWKGRHGNVGKYKERFTRTGGGLDRGIRLEVGRVLRFHSEGIAEILGHFSLLCGSR
jgi:hypothetical protein